VPGQASTETDEGAHDLDVHGCRPGLRRTLDSIATPCSVNAWGSARRLPLQPEITICDLRLAHSEFGGPQPETEIGGEAAPVAFDRLRQRTQLDAVEDGEVRT
jgi:hypothetical protein